MCPARTCIAIRLTAVVALPMPSSPRAAARQVPPCDWSAPRDSRAQSSAWLPRIGGCTLGAWRVIEGGERNEPFREPVELPRVRSVCRRELFTDECCVGGQRRPRYPAVAAARGCERADPGAYRAADSTADRVNGSCQNDRVLMHNIGSAPLCVSVMSVYCDRQNNRPFIQ